MEEQKNLNNPSGNQPDASATQKNIPTVAGTMILLIVAVIVGAGVFYLFQVSSLEVSQVNPVSLKNPAQKEKTPDVSLKTPTEIPAIAETAAEEEVVPLPKAGETFNFDYELKKLDDQNNAINPDDFNENEISDANIGV
jgi:hypothetical protein